MQNGFLLYLINSRELCPTSLAFAIDKQERARARLAISFRNNIDIFYNQYNISIIILYFGKRMMIILYYNYIIF